MTAAAWPRWSGCSRCVVTRHCRCAVHHMRALAAPIAHAIAEGADAEPGREGDLVDSLRETCTTAEQLAMTSDRLGVDS